MKKIENRFSDTLKKSFIKYSTIIMIIPIVLIIILLLFYNLFTTYYSNHKNNYYVNDYLSLVYSEYDQFSINNNDFIIDNLINKENVPLSYKKIYQFHNQVDLKSNIYILDNNFNIIFNKEEVPLDNLSSIKMFASKLDNYQIKSLVKYNNKTKISHHYLIKPIHDDNLDNFGYWVFEMNYNNFINTISHARSDIFVVIDKHNNIIYDSSNSLSNIIGKINLKYDKHFTSIEGTNHLLTISSNSRYEYKVISLSNLSLNTTFIVYGLILFISFIILTLLTVFKVADKISKENSQTIDQIIDGINRIQNNNLDEPIQVSHSNDLSLIADQLNITAGLLKDNQELQERNRITELKKLENQFNPHFMFNILETIKYMIAFDSNKAINLIVRLARILRYSINYDNAQVTIEDDLRYIKDYLLLQKVRFNDKLQYNINIQESLLSCLVIKLLLQPIVENSLKYGLDAKDTINIEIKIYEENNNLILEVIDDGLGIENDSLLKLNESLLNDIESNHIGLYNTNRRIKLMYGNDYGLSVSSKLNKFTKVTIIIPLIRKESLCLKL